MSLETVQAVVDWQNTIGGGEQIEITFHGGEPLLAGIEYYKKSLPVLREGLSFQKVSFAIQSNLWLLTDAMCEIFKVYNVSIGTSLDGPEAINDAQRGSGYYRRTMASLERARAHGMSVGCICTFTAQSVRRAGEVFDFFLHKGQSFSTHAALPPLGYAGDGWALSPEAYGELLVGMLERYVENSSRIRVRTLDDMCQSISSGQGGICTFGECLGKYLAVDPEGWIYSCQRLAGMPEYRLGNVYDYPTPHTLATTPAWRMFQDRQERIGEECGDCTHFNYCRGGCPYNALAANGGSFDHALRDPYCPAYKRAFEMITERALEDVFSDENMAAVVAGGNGKHGLLQKGKLVQIMRGGPHPQEVAQGARKVVAAVALASSTSQDEAINKLEHIGLVTDRNLARQSLAALQSQLCNPTSELVNAYIHVTYACNLSCEHCYANAGPQQVGQSLPVEDVARLVGEAAQAGFRKAVITGGEPLVHPKGEMMLDTLADLRRDVKPMQIVLRTNLALSLTPALMKRLSQSADQIVISVDGDQASHDARRGKGTYARTLSNLRSLIGLSNPPSLTIAATLNAAQIAGAEGQEVRSLGEALGVAVRVKPVLPLGRAAGLPLAPEFCSSLDEDCDALVATARLAATCGLGMNLYIDPSGECFPCYALLGAAHALGNAFEDGLQAVLVRNDAYRHVTVDNNQKCGHCGLRYLCGGFCRAWSVEDDPNAPPRDCTSLQERAQMCSESAMQALEIPTERWDAAGLPPEYRIRK
jgi:uncharacterized protein